METGDGRTEDRGGLPRNEENVIRLPRDWLGPPEELVPIGSAARARAGQSDLEDAMPPAADAFWSEDSAALHDAVQAPPTGGGDRLAPPVGLVPPVAGLRPPPSIRLPSSGALRALSRLSWRWSLAAVAVAAVAVAAVIGTTEGPVSHRVATHTPPSHTAPSADLTASTDAAAAEKAAAGRRTHVVTQRQPGSRSGAHARTHTRGTRVVKTHHRAVPHHSAGSSHPAVTEAAASPSPTHSSGSSVSTTPTASTASTVASTGSKPAAGRAGPTGFGQMTGGCLPKCK